MTPTPSLRSRSRLKTSRRGLCLDLDRVPICCGHLGCSIGSRGKRVPWCRRGDGLWRHCRSRLAVVGARVGGLSQQHRRPRRCRVPEFRRIRRLVWAGRRIGSRRIKCANDLGRMGGWAPSFFLASDVTSVFHSGQLESVCHWSTSTRECISRAFSK